mgnify:CR=1 FL=1
MIEVYSGCSVRHQIKVSGEQARGKGQVGGGGAAADVGGNSRGPGYPSGSIRIFLIFVKEIREEKNDQRELTI